MLDAGALRHSVQLQEDSGTADSHGQNVPVWTTYATVKAGIRPLRGTELMIAKQNDDQVTHAVRIHHRTDVKAEHRILFGVREFAILAVLNVGELNQETELLSVETPS